MSKEQTPIAELQELINVHLSNRGFSKEYLLNNRGLIGAVIEEMESRVNAKVLEALEREVVSAFNVGYLESQNDKYKSGQNYFKTEVKPKYQNKKK